MLIKNMDETNVNGSMGTIIEFKEPQNYQTNPDDPFAVNTKPASKSGPQAGGKEKGKSASLIQKWPVVEFTNPRRTMLVQPESWKVELPDGEVQVSRTQVRPCSVRSVRFDHITDLDRSSHSSSLGQCLFINLKARHLNASRLILRESSKKVSQSLSP